MSCKQTENVVVYSALFGKAEPVNPHLFGRFASCRKVIFTDNPELSLPGAEVILDQPIPGDPVRSARRVKHLPHRYLPQAEWSIWIDNKSSLQQDPVRIVEAAARQGGADFFAYPHFVRSCLYDEAKTVIQNGLDDATIVRRQIRRYRAAGMPKGQGLIESHFIVRRHTEENAAFGEAWFAEIMAFSRRDQISFPYLAWKRQLAHTALDDFEWSEVATFSVFDRERRAPEFQTVSPLYVAARKVYHKVRSTIST